MNKQAFLCTLRAKLSGLPQKDAEERLNFYSEMIDDRVEEGYTEAQAISEIGSVDQIAAQIISDIPLLKIAKKKIKPKRRLKALEIVLLAIGSPIWLSLGIAALAVILSLYISFWAIIVSLWAIFVSLAACAVCGILAGIAFASGGTKLPGIAIACAGIVSAGLTVFLFFGCKAATKGALTLAKKTMLGIKKRMMKKENVS